VNIKFTEEFSDKLHVLKRRQPNLTERLRKQLKIFRIDPKYPSLRNHKLKGGMKEKWSISFGDNWRAVYFVEGDAAVFYDLGTHDEVYKK
jgi:addiction module RelE/StbE family toxin